VKAVCALAHSYGVRVILDAARVVENAFFIQNREPGCGERTIASIVKELCSYTDGCHDERQEGPAGENRRISGGERSRDL